MYAMASAGGAAHRLTAGSLTVPETVVAAKLPSGSDRRHDDDAREDSLGSLTTTRDDVPGVAPLTTVERLEPLASLVPPSTTCVGTSQTGPVCTVLGKGVAGGQQGSR
jgi:hypothetical protein